jgi:hypothetical protein
MYSARYRKEYEAGGTLVDVRPGNGLTTFKVGEVEGGGAGAGASGALELGQGHLATLPFAHPS